MPCTRRQGTSPAKKNLKPKMASILATLFCIIVTTYKKDGEQKAKPKIASKKLPRISPPMGNYFRVVGLHVTLNRLSLPTTFWLQLTASSLPRVYATGETQRPQTAQGTHCVPRESQKHTYQSLSVVQLPGGSSVHSSLSVCASKAEYNVSTQVGVTLCLVRGAKEPAQQRKI